MKKLHKLLKGKIYSGIIEAVAEMFLAGVITADGVVDGSLAERSDRLVPDGRTYSFLLHDGKQRIAVTQTDVRQIQLAKAALYAGARLMMDRMGIDRVDGVGHVAGEVARLHALVDAARVVVVDEGRAARAAGHHDDGLTPVLPEKEPSQRALHAQQRPLHGRPGLGQVGRLIEAGGDGALGLVAGLLGGLEVDLGREVGIVDVVLAGVGGLVSGPS